LMWSFWFLYVARDPASRQSRLPGGRSGGFMDSSTSNR
jgi:hypothetical protein